MITTKMERLRVYRKRLYRLQTTIDNNNPNVELTIRLCIGMAELIGQMEQQIKQGDNNV